MNVYQKIMILWTVTLFFNSMALAKSSQVIDSVFMNIALKDTNDNFNDNFNDHFNDHFNDKGGVYVTELSSKGDFLLCAAIHHSSFYCFVIEDLQDFQYNYHDDSVDMVFLDGSKQSLTFEDLYTSKMDDIHFVMNSLSQGELENSSLALLKFFKWLGSQLFWEHGVPEYEDIKKKYKEHQRRTRKKNEPRMRELRREALSNGHGSEDLPKVIQSPQDYHDYIEVEMRHFDDPLGPPEEMIDFDAFGME